MRLLAAGALAVIVAGRLGESDCERIGDRVLAQPVNTVTSFAYAVAGLVVVAVDRRRHGRPAPLTVGFAAGLVAISVGSVLFHGPQPEGARVLHDLPIVITAWLMLWNDLRTLAPHRIRWPAAAVGAAATAVIVIAEVETAIPLTVALLAAVIVCEAVIHRRRLRRVDPRAQLRGFVVLGAGSVVAGLMYWLGRSGSPACSPDSPLQFHGVWHVSSAALFAWWWWLAVGAPARADRPPRRSRSQRAPDRW